MTTVTDKCKKIRRHRRLIGAKLDDYAFPKWKSGNRMRMSKVKRTGRKPITRRQEKAAEREERMKEKRKAKRYKKKRLIAKARGLI